MVDSSAGSMFSSAAAIFLSSLHAKVARERLVQSENTMYILILYFMKLLSLSLHRAKPVSVIKTFFTFKDVDSIFLEQHWT